MLKNKKSYFTLQKYLLFWVVALIFGCAAMQNPQGGPRDTTPPKILKVEPKDLSTNFIAKKVVIEFDEYFKLNNQYKEFSVSPDVEKQPVLKINKRRLEIAMPDSLEKNTTYTLNFGKMITDINEGNELKNFTYVFSTGPTLDSLSISGKVTDAVTGTPQLDALVFILPLQKDTIFGKKRPSIYATTDSSGNYQLKNLRKDNYRLYAIKEQGGGDKIYQQQNDEVAFFNDTIKLSKNIDSANLLLFKEIPTDFRVKDKKINNEGFIQLSWNKALKNAKIDIINLPDYNKEKIVITNKGNDSAKVWLPKMEFDSLLLTISEAGKTLDTVKVSRGKKDTYSSEIKAADNLESGSLNPNKFLKISFNTPIKSLDISKLILLEDSIPRKGFTVEKDSNDVLSILVKYNWKPKSSYNLDLKPGAITGIQGAVNKAISKQFNIASKDDYGTLILDVKIPDTTANYILEVVDEKKENVISTQIVEQSKKLLFANYKAGVYFVRITYDENKNDVWDTGDVAERRQPEKIWYAPTELSIRANWERNEKLDIPKLLKTN